MFNTIHVRTNILLTITSVVVILALTMFGLQIYLGERLAQKATQQAFSQTLSLIHISEPTRPY